MNKILLTLSLLTSLIITSAYAKESVADKAKTIQIDNLRVDVINNKTVQVYKDDKKMFGIKCPNSATCMVYTTNSNNPTYQYDAGELRLGGEKPGSIYKLSIDNIQAYKPRKFYDDKYISFIIITSGGSASSRRGRYDIDTEHGWFYTEETDFDWLRYGRQENYPYGD